ncbi:MAG: hypothetical protein IJG32_06040 [Selenomonadaceae bacterium]|nr:hypothetical protein [Selenomonadaceae bacterium]
MILDDERTLRILKDAPNAHIIKIFFWIAFHQPQDGIYGYKIPKSQIAGDLKLGRTVLFDSLHWLKNNLFIQELKIDEESDFMVNPNVVMNNSDFKDRMNEWNRRCKLDIQREIRLKKEKRRRELKKQAQQ